MRRVLAVVFLLAAALVPRAATAHPGTGLVVAADGTVYFVIMGRSVIMRIGRDARLSVLVEDERLGLPHHLALDGAGNLYTISDAERVLWRVSPGGQITQVMRGSIGTWGDPFAMDAAGAVYSITEQERSRIVKVSPAGAVTPFAGGPVGYADGPPGQARFGDLHFGAMHIGPGGLLHVTDRTRLRALGPDGSVSTVPTVGVELKMAMGMAQAGADLLVADFLARRVVRVGSAGASIVPGSDGLLASGVAVGPDGAVYVLDNPPMATCVWRVSDGMRSKYACVRLRPAGALYTVFGLLAVLALAVIIRPPPRAATWIIAVLVLGLLTAVSLGIATSARLEGFRPVMLGLFLAAVVIPAWERIARWRGAGGRRAAQ